MMDLGQPDEERDWAEEWLPGISPDVFIASARQAVSFLAEATGKMSGRFHRLHAEVENLRAEGAMNRLLPISFVDLQQLVMIERTLGSCDQDEFHRRLRMMALDAPQPDAGNANTPGRDAQFELYLGACLKDRIQHEVLFAEPDVVVDTGRYRFGFAAKRLKSLRQVGKNFNKAHEQTTREVKSGRLTHGVIAFDVTHLINPRSISPRISDRGFVGESVRAMIEDAKDVIIPVAREAAKGYKRIPRTMSSILLLGNAMEWILPEGGFCTFGDFQNLLVGGEGDSAIRSLGLSS